MNLFQLIVILSLSLAIQLSFAQKLPQAVINEMATRKMRYYHWLWHQVREGWNRFPDATKDAFRQIGWEPPRPARTYDANGVASAIYDNDSGEDFLYMHRTMITTANEILARTRDPYGRVRGWTTIPAPGDRDYPVPPAYEITNNPFNTASAATMKTDSYYVNNLARSEKIFKDPEQLRTMTLGELGARIEITLHGWMHLRWSNVSALGYRSGYRGTIPNVDRMWDDINYNWLADSYSSHVNPIFWKIHGWVDDRIEDWRRANNLTTIRWKGTWTGGPMSNIDSVMKRSGMNMDMNSGYTGSEENIELLEEASRIFKESGVPEVTFADPVKVDWLPIEEEEPKKRKTCKLRKSKVL